MRVVFSRYAIVIPITIVVATACSGDGPTGGGPPVASVSISGPSNTVLAGQTLQLTAVARAANGDVVPDPAIQWSSSASSIASVSASGLVTALAVGEATISARVAAVAGTLAIDVTDNSADIFTPGNIFSPFSTVIQLGGTVRFHIFGDDHNAIFDRSVPGAPADINVVKDVVVERTFNTRGTFPFDCTVHPGMSGQVVVQ